MDHRTTPHMMNSKIRALISFVLTTDPVSRSHPIRLGHCLCLQRSHFSFSFLVFGLSGFSNTHRVTQSLAAMLTSCPSYLTKNHVTTPDSLTNLRLYIVPFPPFKIPLPKKQWLPTLSRLAGQPSTPAPSPISPAPKQPPNPPGPST